jgi:hypothetical protein
MPKNALKVKGLCVCCQDFALALTHQFYRSISPENSVVSKPYRANLAKSFFGKIQNRTDKFS